MRSCRAEHVSRFAKAVLDRETLEARKLLTSFCSRYPIALTRDLDREVVDRSPARTPSGNGSSRETGSPYTSTNPLSVSGFTVRTGIAPLETNLAHREIRIR